MTASMQDEIAELIRHENDPRARAMLILLAKIVEELRANTTMTKEVGVRLDEHLTRYEARQAEENAIRERVRGAWKVLAWVVGTAQAAILAAAAWTVQHIENLHRTDQQIEQRLTRIETMEQQSEHFTPRY